MSENPSEALTSTSGSKRDSSLDRIQQVLGYRFLDIVLLELALTHSSVSYEKQQLQQPAQEETEPLEILGDAVLGLVVTEHLIAAYPEFTEGSLTRLRAQIVSRQHLGRVAQALGLGEYLRLGKGEENSGGRKKSALLANTVEALIAAIYLDAGLQAAAGLVRRWLLDGGLDVLAAATRSGESVGDHKSTLQEYCQAHGLGQPVYGVASEAGPDHHKSFVVEVKLTGAGAELRTLATAAGTRKKDAEQEAARTALISLRSGESGLSGDAAGAAN